MRAKKSLGQHFLRCEWVVSTLIHASAVSPKDTILEIGPGRGILTRALAQYAKKVIAVEKDEILAEMLRTSLKKEEIKNVIIIEGDILTVQNTLPLAGKSYKIVANIPYYLTARILRAFLEDTAQKPQTISLTIQKEVAERIVAKAPHMNLLALSVQAYGTPNIIKTVPASCFAPRPKVDSAIITIGNISRNFFVRHSLNEQKFFTIARAGFGKKRKLLTSTLVEHTGGKTTIRQIFDRLELTPNARPEELTREEWAKLAAEIEQHHHTQY